MIQYNPHRVLYSLSLIFPLFGLLVLNSSGQREKRAKLVQIRQLRQALNTRRTTP